MQQSLKNYSCTSCGQSKKINTNHFDSCWDYCESCSWKGIGFDKTSQSVHMFGAVHRKFECLEISPNRGKYSLDSMSKLPVTTIIQVSQMSESNKIQFESDSQDTRFYQDYFNCKFDSFFVVLNESGDDYAQVWGMFGIVPSLEKHITKIL